MSLSHWPASRQSLGNLDISIRAIAEPAIEHTCIPVQNCDKRAEEYSLLSTVTASETQKE